MLAFYLDYVLLEFVLNYMFLELHFLLCVLDIIRYYEIQVTCMKSVNKLGWMSYKTLVELVLLNFWIPTLFPLLTFSPEYLITTMLFQTSLVIVIFTPFT